MVSSGPCSIVRTLTENGDFRLISPPCHNIVENKITIEEYPIYIFFLNYFLLWQWRNFLEV